MDWIVLGKTKFSPKHYPSYLKLREGDIIKFGKLMFKLREIKNELLNQNTLNQISENHNNNNNEQIASINEDKDILIVNSKKQMMKSCRICLLEGETNGNPLIHICGCIGSVRYIHLDCLRQWLRSKVTIKKNEYTTSYCYKPFQCELCKCVIPEIIKYKDKEITLIDLDNPPLPYAIFQIVNREKSEIEMLYVVSMKTKPKIKIGRANDSDLRFTDISVSRNHAQLIYQDGLLYLEDSKSKFGSLSLMQSAISFIPNLPVSIQKGKFHLKFQLKPTLLSMLCCYKNKDFNNIGYNDTYCYQALLLHSNELGKMKSYQLDNNSSLASESSKDECKDNNNNAINPIEIKESQKAADFKISYSHFQTGKKENDKSITKNNKYKTLPLDTSKFALLRFDSKKTLNENYNKEQKDNFKTNTNRMNTNHNNSLESDICLIEKNNKDNRLLTNNYESNKGIIIEDNHNENDNEKENIEINNDKAISPYSIIPNSLSRMLSNPELFQGVNYSMVQIKNAVEKQNQMLHQQKQNKE